MVTEYYNKHQVNIWLKLARALPECFHQELDESFGCVDGPFVFSIEYNHEHTHFNIIVTYRGCSIAEDEKAFPSNSLIAKLELLK